MQKKRLLKLAALLEADAKNKKGVKFDLGKWGANADGDWQTKPETVEANCNTVACAMGLACISGAFKRQGLTHYFRMAFWGGGYMLWPRLGNARGFHAARKLFEISLKDSEFLFSGLRYPNNVGTGATSELFVAKRIRDFVAGKVAA